MSSIPGELAANALCGIVTPVGMLGYGLDDTELQLGIELSQARGIPTAIILDSGSTDSGPSKLALGQMSTPRSSYVRDLRKLLRAVRQYRVPLLIGSAGGDGTDAHVDEIRSVIEELLTEMTENSDPVSMKILSIYSNIDRALVSDRLQRGKVVGCGQFVPPLTSNDIDTTTQIIAQMGPEPFLAAMMAHPDFDVIVGGRAYDPAPYVAYCAFQAGLAPARLSSSVPSSIMGGFTHMGKIMECGGLCATPKSHGALATVYKDGTFDVRPLTPGAICTALSVAAHTLYEKTRPDRLAGPGGILDLTDATYHPLSDDLSVHVEGSKFEPSVTAAGGHYAIKLEGAKAEGYRSLFFGSFGDPILITQLPIFLDRVKAYVTKQNSSDSNGKPDSNGWWDLDFHIYGFDHVNPAASAREVFIVGEAFAQTKVLAESVASTARVACLHASYPGQKATSGNFGMGIGGPLSFDAGPAASFTVYHLMELEDGEEGVHEVGTDGTAEPGLFTWKLTWAGSGSRMSDLTTPFGKPRQNIPLPSIQQVNGGFEATNSAWTPPTSLTLGDAARIIRSKNSGPYEITMDVMFGNKNLYEWVKASGQLNAERIAKLYGLTIDDVAYCGYFDQALAFKATIPRMRRGKRAVSGGFMENDVHGSQAYTPLSGLILTAKLEKPT